MFYYNILFSFKNVEKQITNFASLKAQRESKPQKKIKIIRSGTQAITTNPSPENIVLAANIKTLKCGGCIQKRKKK